MLRLALFLLLAGAGPLAALSLEIDTAPQRCRPGKQIDLSYALNGFSGAHSIIYSGLPSGVTATPASGSGAGGTITFAVQSGTPAITSTIRITVNADAPATGQDAADLTLRVDPPPTLRAAQTFRLNEDEPAALIAIFDDNDVTDLSISAVSSPYLLADGTPVSTGEYGTFSIPVRASPDFNGTATLRVTVVDLLGPVNRNLTVTVDPVNDPPVVRLDALPTTTMDPRSGEPVAPLRGMTLSANDGNLWEGAVQITNTPTFTNRISFTAEVTGADCLDGVDLLSLRGDDGYRVDAGTIAVLPAGTTIATWTATGTRRVRVRLNAAGTLAHLQEMVRLLRYSHLQHSMTDLQRDITIVVSEPDPAGGLDPSTPQVCSCRVAAVDLPPVVVVQPVVVAPLQDSAIGIAITDQGGLDAISVRVVGPPVGVTPLAGMVAPASCSGAEAVAGGLRYHHTVNDLTEDRLVLEVKDAGNPPVYVAVPVIVRVTPDRLSIISDPLLEVERGTPVAHRLATLPAAATLTLADYGAPLPARPAGVTLVGGVLALDWAQIPAGTAWIALAVEAETSDGTLVEEHRKARQPMLIHVRAPQPIGTAN